VKEKNHNQHTHATLMTLNVFTLCHIEFLVSELLSCSNANSVYYETIKSSEWFCDYDVCVCYCLFVFLDDEVYILA
jgi:hypothetical protein